MQSILMITGLFAGIAVCMSTFYSLSQAILREGIARWAHLAALVAMLMVMGALLERNVTVARVLAAPLMLLAIWTFTLERGVYKVMPALMQLFAAVLLLGYVALTPLPAG